MAYLYDGLGGPRNTVVTLSASQLHTLFTTPITLVNAPPSGYFVYPLRLKSIFAPASNPYGTSSGWLQMYWGTTPLPTENTGSYSTNNSASYGYGTTNSGFLFAWDFWKNQGSNLAGSLASIANAQPLKVKPSFANMTAGGVLTSHVTFGGTGYAPTDTGTLEYVGGVPTPTLGQRIAPSGQATYTVNTVGGGGDILTYTVDTPGALGTGYFAGDAGVLFTPDVGGGDGAATATIDTVTPGDGALKLYLEYTIIPTS